MLVFHYSPDVVSENRFVKVGKKKLRLLVVRLKKEAQAAARGEAKPPCVLWIHGGGYMIGMPEMVFFSRAIDLVERCGAVVVSPDYSLSPFAPYPQALKECHAALKYVKKHADELGIDKSRIIVGGESAGGGLCAALCMLAKDKHSVNIAFQLPLYPMIDCFDTESSRDNHAKVWNTQLNHLGWWMYLRRLKGRKVPCYASPAQRRNYEGLPPCYTFIGDLEPFYAETLTFVENLQKAGVDAKVDVYQDFYHAYDMVQADKPEAQRAADVFVAEFQRMCEQYTAEN